MKNLTLGLIIICTFFIASKVTYAHCDTLDGPVIKDARAALEKGDVTPVLKWVKKESEPEIRVAFGSALAERSKGNEARENGDMKLFETLVRVHRAGEGEPFAGLKPVGSVEPIIAKADKALETGSVDVLTSEITDYLTNEMKERFNKVLDKKKNMNESVDAGREYVEAYVDYMHYVEGVHGALAGTGGHHHEKSVKSTKNENRDAK